MNEITITKVNEVYIRIDTDQGIFRELAEYLTFFAANYKWNPKFRNKIWDGKIRMLHSGTKMCYGGLINYIEDWALERGYKVHNETGDFANEFSLVEAQRFIKRLNLPFEPHDYQIKYFVNAIRYKKCLEVSPTSSGKSLILYLIIRWLLENEQNVKLCLIVPTVALTEQLYTDFIDYGWEDAKDYCHLVYSGKEKDVDKPIIISTWQSLFRKDESWFDRYTVMIADEAHEMDADSAKHILGSSTNASYRIGVTGTLKDTKVSQFTLEGLFGPSHQEVTTKELIDRNILAQFAVKALVLKHSKESCQKASVFDYQGEVEYLIGSESRNRYISNLALSLTGNTLILYRYVEKHGKILYELISKAVEGTGRNVYYIDGSTDISDREIIRKILETEKDAILIASTGTFSRGSNVKNLYNLIIAFPNKAKVRLLQSIGRALRKLEGKKAILYDIADDLRVGKKENITLKHFVERIKVYASEKFDYKMYKIQLKE